MIKNTFIAALVALLGAFAVITELMTIDAADSVKVTLILEAPHSDSPVYIVGNHGSLGPWRPDGRALEWDGTAYTVTLTLEPGFELEYNFTKGSWDEKAVGPSDTIMPNSTLTATDGLAARHVIAGFSKSHERLIADVAGSGLQGTIEHWLDVSSEFLSETRHVAIWLPPQYHDDPSIRYPVIYMTDGHALFDPRMSSDGTDWGADEAMVAGAEAGRHPWAIIVGVWNTNRRISEYSPWHEGPNYARFLIEELKPRIDAAYRTKIGREDTFHAGSSMGGLVSYMLIRDHPEVFSACGCLSAHVSFSEGMMAAYKSGNGLTEDTGLTFIEQDILAGKTVPAGQRMMLDYGTEGLDAAYEGPHLKLREQLQQSGFREGEDFTVERVEGAGHNVQAWRKRIGTHFEFMLGRPSNDQEAQND